MSGLHRLPLTLALTLLSATQAAAQATITTVAGNGTRSFSGDGGSATNASISLVAGLAVDSAGSLYIADSENGRIRKVDTDGIITTVAGNGTRSFSGDGGPATSASLSGPMMGMGLAGVAAITVGFGTGLAVDSAGSLYIADFENRRIRKVDTNGIITTVAGNGSEGFSGDGGPATSASLSPGSIAMDGAGNLLVADFGNTRIRRVNSDGIITTVAGSGTQGARQDGIPATSASLVPLALAADRAGNVYVVDFVETRQAREQALIRRIDTDGIITTLAELDVSGGLNLLMSGMAVDQGGDLYISADGSHVLKIDASQ